MKKLFGLFSILVFVFSCADNSAGIENDNSVVVKKGYYKENGKIKWEGHYINDTIRNGEYKQYYLSGGVKRITYYKLGKLDSIDLNYNENGNLSKKAYWKNDKQEGQSSYFYVNGKLRAVANFRNNSRVGEYREYYQNGNPKEYGLYTHSSKLRLRIKYDNLGNFISQEGAYYGSSDINAWDYDSVWANQEFRAELLIATPPHNRVSLKMGELDSKGKSLLNVSELPVKNNLANYKNIFSETGSHSFVVVLEAYDSLQKGTIRESDTIRIKVVKISPDKGLKFTKEGLGFEIEKNGNGNFPKKGDKVTVKYLGTFPDGKIFDNSHSSSPLTFILDNDDMIKGWGIANMMLKKGGVGYFKVPPDLAYGETSFQNIPPNSTLIYKIEVVDIEQKK